MSKVGALQFVTDLSLGQADSAISDKFFDDVIFDLSKDQWFTAVTFLSQFVATSEYGLPTDVINIIAIFSENRMLFKATERELEFQSPHWRSEVGQPIAYSTENEDDGNFRLYKIPNFDGSLTVLHTRILDPDAAPPATPTDIPDWLELPV
ncbi:hypothetical protein IIA15_07915, partial [candidate division TA06 bacterium]|nr:hypothetical protein [candidate division TA06 bacterium]